jgi:hypothetical protein
MWLAPRYAAMNERTETSRNSAGGNSASNSLHTPKKWEKAGLREVVEQEREDQAQREDEKGRGTKQNEMEKQRQGSLPSLSLSFPLGKLHL